MKSRSKTFARKLVALFLAVVMAVSCFTGVITAYAKSTDGYYDDKLAANFMTWAETTDNQTAEALLDWADMHLDDIILSLGATGDMMDGDHLHVNVDITVAKINLEGYLDSIDGVLDIISKARVVLDKYKGLIGGDVNNLDLSAIDQLNTPSTRADELVSKCGKSYRATNDAKDIILSVAKLLYVNSNDDSGKNVLGQFFKGDLSLGLIGNFVDLWSLLQSPLGLWDGYQSNLVYNIVSNLIITKSGWYEESEIEALQNKVKANKGQWVLDDQLMDKLSVNLMQKINAEITYAANGPSENAGTESSHDRYKKIQAKMAADGITMEAAATALGYDSNLKYTPDGNVYLFCYGDQKLVITKNTKLLTLGYEVLSLAWKTCLKDTLATLRVNYSHEDNQNYGTNYDNSFYYWMRNNKTWNTSNWAANYTDANVRAWATAVYKDYDAADAQDFIDDVRDNLTLDRTIGDDATGSWKDIDSTKLFLKVRYSPLADKYYGMQTGPINLYFMETGFTNLETFFKNAKYSTYSDLPSILNDVLVAAVKDLFPDSANIGFTKADGTVQSISRPAINEAGVTSFTGNLTQAQVNTRINDMATTLVTNAVHVFEYAANCTDANILNGYYISKGTSASAKMTSNNLSEADFEEAMIPFLISCIRNIEDTKQIHDAKWDACQDAEGVAYVALEEYLSYVLPDKDYSSLVKLNAQGKYVAGNHDINGDNKYTMFEDAIMPMARDALGFILQSIVPCRTKTGAKWNVYNTNPITDTTTIFDILNSIVCYYAGTDTFSDGGFNSTNTKGKSAAAILGAVNTSGNNLVKMSNTLWQNIDAIANNLLPVLGTLQYGDIANAANFNSYELLYNKIIKGILDIGPNSGVTNFVKQLLTIFTAEPIRNKGIVELIYDDVLASFINNLFGARYSGQTYKQVVPYTYNYTSSTAYTNANPLNKMTDAQSNAPFDSLVQRSILALYSYTTDKKNGVIGLVLENVYEFFAYSTTNSNFRSSKSTQVGASGCWEGAMFLVKAVNNFIPSFVPQLGEHTFKPATVNVAISSASGVDAGAPMSGNSLKFKNNAVGLNRFYKTSNGTIAQDPRYYTVIRNVVVRMGNQNPSNVAVDRNVAIGKVVAPGETFNIPISGTYPEETQNLSITVTYDVFESASATSTAPSSDSAYLYQNLQTVAYMYLSPDKGWVDALFNNTDESGIKGTVGTRGNYVAQSTAGGAGNGTRAEYYKKFLIPNNNTSSINDYGLMITGGGRFDSLFSYPVSGTKYYAVTGVDENGKYVTGAQRTANANQSDMAYVSFDSNGNLLHNDLQDFKWDSDADWDRGGEDLAGYDQDEIQAIIDTKAVYDEEGNVKSCPGYKTRTHIAYTPEEAIDENAIKGIIKNGDSIDAILVDKDIIGDYVSPGTPLKEISLVGGSVSLSSNSQYIKWLNVTNTAKVLTPQEFDMNLATVTNGSVGMRGTTHVIVFNNAGAITLQNKYNSLLSQMSPYNKTDFDDLVGSGNTSYSPVQNLLNTAFSNTVVSLGAPVTEASAVALSSITETVASKFRTSSATGDLAYAPLPASATLPDNITGYVRDGYYYADEDCTLPIYSNTELTSATNGTDAVGTPVTEINGKYYLANSPSYKTEWIIIEDGDLEFPYLLTTEDRAYEDEEETKPLYEQTRYNFYLSNGDQTGDTGWTYKIPQSTEIIKPYDGVTDYRGTYDKYSDMLDYRVEQAKKHVDVTIADVIGVGVSEARRDLVNVDYIVDTYEKKVKVAKEAESLITKEPIWLTNEDGEYVNEEGDVVDDDHKVWDHDEYSTSNPSVAIYEAKRIYDRYDARVQSRGFIGDKLAAEIKCASGLNVNQLTVSGGNVYYTANYDAKYGAYDNTGKLINPTIGGELEFSTSSWNAYVDALADAITTYNEANCKISEAYGTKKTLALAENNLEAPSARTDVTISGKISVATDAAGTASRTGVAGVRIKVGNKTYAYTANNGEFTAVLPLGTTSFTVSGNNIITRTINISGEADVEGVNIGIINTDYNADGAVNSVDAFLFSETGKISDAGRDVNGDGSVDTGDGAILNNAIKNGVNYATVNLG